MNSLRKIRTFFGITQAQLSVILGVGQNTISMIEKGKITLGSQNRIILTNILHINPLWFDECQGDMLLPNSPYSENPRAIDDILAKGYAPRVPRATTVEIPTFQTPVQPPATPITTIRGVPYFAENIGGKIDYYIDIQPFNDCNFYRSIYGDSMAPRYNHGDMIACKKVNDKSMIMYGEAYLCLIRTSDEIQETVKILRLNADPTLITLTCANPNFDQTVIAREDIIELYILKGKIERSR